MSEASHLTPDESPACLEDALETIRALRRDNERLEQRAETAEADARAFRELAEHIHEVFWMTNALGDKLIYISPAYEAIWGQTCQSLYSDPGRRLAWVHDDDRERVLKAFKRDAREGRYDETYRITRPDGEIRWIRDRAWRVYDDEQALYRLAGFANDITNEIADNDQRAELGDRLAVRERFSLFAAIGAGVAHDIGQPLTAARTQLARTHHAGRHSGATWYDAVLQADDEIERASTIVRHLRDYARHGQPSIDWHQLDRMLAEVQRLYDSALRRERIQLRLHIADEAAEKQIAVDRIFLQQILRNLIQNAIDALLMADTPDHQRRIDVSVRLPDPYHVEICVSDNGTGIEDGIDAFAAFDSTKLDGLGLGLHISRSLARSHGGDLEISRAVEPGMQTKFVLNLPCDGRSAPRIPPAGDISVADALGA
ncbi:sensor histidine kinase [Salinisphaera sp. Q1T1-3]|uniref:sensor histidine kinase n=1 Tax=Salinisphaera sp. Q1T1-3 TaxID=2321229 RepID=UPI000E7350B8|nr:ATP-binding protein [Salinisphaera sp. Q1T1-3]RJS91406.1 PAS domain S-box protein [Salinisphaera sp. Q1T1-3]